MDTHDCYQPSKDDIARIAAEIIVWQNAALDDPLADVREIVNDLQGELASTLTAFNEIFSQDMYSDYDLHHAIAKVARTATIAAIYTLGLIYRTTQEAATSS